MIRFGIVPAASLSLALFVCAFAAGSQEEPPLSDVEQLAATIDRHIAAVWTSDGVSPAPAADDAEFLRRISLDLAGKIPNVSHVRRFLEDPHPDKRTKLIDELLESPRYVVHFTNVWRSLLLPEAVNNPQLALQVEGFEAWLRTQLFEEAGYDRIVHRLITTELTMDASPSRREGGRRQPTAAAFFIAKEGKPENLTAGITRQFLGIRLECAECHDHPFASWKRHEFWGLAAFFSGIQSDNPFAVRETTGSGRLKVPGTDREVVATFLDGSTPASNSDPDRETLADWITDPRNPYFARAAVNRIWAHFFGVGLVVPVDDMELDNPPSHPELLSELSQQFVAHGYDLKFLIRAITNSRTYQLSSKLTDPGQEDVRYFARMAVRGLSPEQIFDSLEQATGLRDDAARQEFLERFASDGGMSIDVHSTILQALTMMNGRFIGAATHLEQSATLTAAAEFPLFDDRQRIETLFLAALARRPTDQELSRMTQHLESAAGDKKTALADVFWVLLNSSEFLFNH